MDTQLSIAARTLWQEARGEPIEGQKAVAHSILNRVEDGRWGKTLMSVCLFHHQYSAWGPVVPSNPDMLADYLHSCALPDSDTGLLMLAAVMTAAETEPDPTAGATHYYDHRTPTPPWALPPAIYCGQFGSQKFYRGVK